MAGFMDMFDGFTKSDVGGLLGGVGALTGAWGTYTNNKKQTKLLTDQLNYEKQKDALANTRFTEDRAALKDAFATTPKKKKNLDGTDIADGYVLNQFNGQ